MPIETSSGVRIVNEIRTAPAAADFSAVPARQAEASFDSDPECKRSQELHSIAFDFREGSRGGFEERRTDA